MVTGKFDIQAVMPAGALPEQMPDMLQSLLAERFHLVIHRSTKEHAAYALVAGKSDLKLKESPAGADGSGWTRSLGPDGGMHMETKAMTMSAIADLIARFLDYPVVDMTGLAGRFDVPLDFSPEDLRTGSRLAGAQQDGDPGLPAAGSALFSSVQHVGLRLAPRRLPIDLIVVDRLDQVPTAN